VVIDTISNTLTGSDSFLFRFSPFQVVPNDSLGLFFKPEEMASYISVDTGYAGIPRVFPPHESSIFFLFFVLCFFMFSLFYRSERKTLFANFKNLLGFRKRATSVYKEQVTAREIWAEMFLLFQTLLIFSMVYFVLFWDRGIVDMLPGNRNLLFLCVFLTLGAFVFLRYVMYSFLGIIFFPLKFRNWLGKYLQIVELIGIVSFFPAFFYIFLPEIASFAFVLLLAIFFMSRLGIMIAVFDIFVKNKIGFFYFIVYLCGIEILPYFLFYSGLISLITVVGSIAL